MIGALERSALPVREQGVKEGLDASDVDVRIDVQRFVGPLCQLHALVHGFGEGRHRRLAPRRRLAR
eukprot:scaffold3305_cov328-Pinguiococcus_pyrenoidosus.AAC.6